MNLFKIIDVDHNIIKNVASLQTVAGTGQPNYNLILEIFVLDMWDDRGDRLTSHDFDVEFYTFFLFTHLISKFVNCSAMFTKLTKTKPQH